MSTIFTKAGNLQGEFMECLSTPVFFLHYYCCKRSLYSVFFFFFWFHAQKVWTVEWEL